jgi:small subunit ribosomal protein S8
MVDPITDMLNRIRNGQAVSKKTVIVPFSELKFQIAKILEREGFVGGVRKWKRKQKKIIELELKYEESLAEPDQVQNSRPAGKAAISELRRISKPGKRIYSGVKNISQFKKGRGVVVVSTPKGVMTDKEARKQGVGGEVLFEIW